MDRTSVAAGDDALPHARTLDLPADTALAAVVADLVARHFLATIAGGRATWILTGAGRPLAVVAQQWAEPRYLVDPTLPIGSLAADGRGVTLLFRYWKQHDPDLVFTELAAGREPRR
ncbi:hypothetical protein [Streptomyces hainanensis]|uniref:Uncharacterized protein n=1 Tax=Streptomyces hainanensis TaxID=402648 RepID=A0A4R4SLC6_9ACTN|nr:hypothetical protein [Streptomyces hainanensis]TDC64458.1 hypothetical protein E1283_31530 [Streptomyces hainanensis]